MVDPEEQKAHLRKYRALLLVCGYDHKDVIQKLSVATELESMDDVFEGMVHEVGNAETEPRTAMRADRHGKRKAGQPLDVLAEAEAKVREVGVDDTAFHKRQSDIMALQDQPTTTAEDSEYALSRLRITRWNVPRMPGQIFVGNTDLESKNRRR